MTSFIHVCSFHNKSLEMVTPNNFALVTTSRSFPLSLIGSNTCFFLANEILSSLYLSGFKWTLLFCDHSATLLICCTPLISPLGQPLML